MDRELIDWAFRIRLICAMGGLVLLARSAMAQSPALPDAPGRDTVERVCGACHPATVVMGRGRTREEWGQVVASMITRGAKGSAADFETVTNYLAKNLPAKASAGAGPARHTLSAGPKDRQAIDEAAARRGERIYAADCASCHGPLARGTEQGPDLVRSVTLLHDRYGDTLTAYLVKQHPAAAGTAMASLTGDQIKDLSHFLHKQVEDTLRGGPFTKVLNVMTGNAQAGAAYFNGPGGCAECHSATGDLAGVASKYDGPTLQQRMLFPRTIAIGNGPVMPPKPVTVTVTTADGGSVTGTLAQIDDFNIALRDETGTYQSWKRTDELKIEVHDPYAAHDRLLDRLSDADIHNLVAYLETLQ